LSHYSDEIKRKIGFEVKKKKNKEYTTKRRKRKKK